MIFNFKKILKLFFLQVPYYPVDEFLHDWYYSICNSIAQCILLDVLLLIVVYWAYLGVLIYVYIILCCVSLLIGKGLM